jgi:hypothetical protein
VIDEDLLATATLILIVGAPVNLEGEVPEQRIACMLRSAPIEVIGSPDAGHFVRNWIAENVCTASCWQGRSSRRPAEG